MTGRYRGGIFATMILALAIVALMRMEMATSERASRRELIVSLALPATTDLDEVARLWVTEIESRIRTVAAAERISGEVWQSGAWLRITLPAADDPVARAAHLSIELEPLRDRLPEGASLHVFQSGEGSTGELMTVLMKQKPDRPAALALRETIVGVPGVREVHLVGVPQVLVDLQLLPGVPPESGQQLRDVLRTSTPRSLGMLTTGGRQIEILSDAPGGPLENRPVGSGFQRVDELSRVTYGTAEPSMRFRVDGREAAGLIIYREPRTDIFDLDREVRAALAQIERDRGIGLEVLESEAEGMRILLQRWLLGLTLASILLSALLLLYRRRHPVWSGNVTIALLPWISASGAVLALFFSGRAVDADRLAIAILASTSAIPFGFLILRFDARRRVNHLFLWVGSLILIPLTIELISSAGLLEISTDATLFMLTGGASAAALTGLAPAVLPTPRPKFLRAYRSMLARSATVVLGATSLLFVLFTLFGTALDPRNEAPLTRTDELSVRLQMPPGATIGGARDIVARAEREANTLEGVGRIISQYDDESAFMSIQVDDDQRDRDEFTQLSLALQYRLSKVSAGVEVRPASVDAGDLAARPEDVEPRTDADAFSYRGVLRGSSATGLRTAVGRIRDRAPVARLAARDIRVERERMEPRIELTPRADAPDSVRSELKRIVDESDGLLSSIPLTGEIGGSIEIRPWWSTKRFESRALSQLLEQPSRAGDGALAPADWTTIRETYHPASMQREDGQFIQIFSAAFPWTASWLRERMRENLHRSLRALALPGGVDLRLPQMDQSIFSVRRLRMIAIFVMAPVVFFLFAVFILNRLLFEPAAAIVPALAAAAAGAVHLYATATPISATAILALLGTGATGLYVALALLHQGIGGPGGGSATTHSTYRAARELLLSIAPAAVAVLAILLSLALQIDGSRFGWASLFSLAASSFGASFLAATFVSSGALLLLVDSRKLPRDLELRRGRERRWIDARIAAQLSVQAVTKIYPNGKQALSDVTFELESGIVALLGPNGAGKSTLIRILTGLVQPTRGVLRFKGDQVEVEDLSNYRRLIGYLPQEFNAYPQFSAEQFLDYWGIEIGITERRARREEIEQILVAVGLDEHADRKVRDFSGGMRQRIGIARALLGAPPVVIVDEPTTGLDIEARQRLRSILRTVAVRRIVILSTHIASDVEGTASRVLLLNQGRLQFDGSPEELTAVATGHTFETLVDDRDLHELTREYRITARVRTVDGIHVRGVARSDQSLPGHEVRPNLEEGYLTVIDETSGSRADRGQHHAWIRDLFTSRQS